ncbi:MAG: peptide/nickel transport system substrate-binding protein [Solirubrobacteraceae bacterium]|nr:peptide/nickel transport system substrate-binding protein [Solirubrobacteraceae bacterium]
MRSSHRVLGAAAAVLALAVAVGACGGSSDTTDRSGGGGTITALMGTAPDYLDPQQGYTTQAGEATWLSYLGLYTYAHANGEAGSKVIPALATDYPKLSDGGRTYEMTLRKGMRFSDGSPVKAADVAYTIQRVLKINWGGKSFFANYVRGAPAYNKGTAKTISGIKTDDATGKITISLTEAYGPFLNVLAFPAAGVVPSGTKMAVLANDPPPGVGPYKITDVVPNRSFKVVRNKAWTDATIPGVPAGKVDVDVKIASNTQTEAEQVLDNQADVFDWGDQLPPTLLSQVTAKASGRYAKQSTISTFYFFLNTQTKPFSSQLAREAVNMAIDRRALSRLNGGTFQPTCHFLPDGMKGHSTSPCPYGDPNAAPDLAKARALLKRSGMAGEPVTVWSQNRSPRKEFVSYYTSVLNKLGFKAKTKLIADAQYFPTIGNLKLNAQTGFDDWNQDFPHPSNFYLLLDERSIQPTNNQNHSQVRDPHIQSELAALNPVAADKLDSVAGRWAALDDYVAKKAYLVAFGQQQVPKFTSDRLDFGAALFSPVYGNDWSSFALK